MAFTNNYRLERVYFERLKSMIDVLKSWLETETDEKTRTILENSIDDNGAILLLYRNLGEAWAELSDLIKKADEKIDSLDDKTEQYHDELNERIDEVNNYIVQILRELEARLEAVEQDLATMSRVKFLDLVEESGVYSLLDGETPVMFDSLNEMQEFPHYVIVRGEISGVQKYFIPKISDNDETTGEIYFYADNLANNELSETVVKIDASDLVTVTTETLEVPVYTAGFGIDIDSNNEISVDTDVIQEKLVAGSGISIDPDTNEIENTAQGATYSAGTGISIDSNNVISNTGLDVLKLRMHSGQRMSKNISFKPLFESPTLVTDPNNQNKVYFYNNRTDILGDIARKFVYFDSTYNTYAANEETLRYNVTDGDELDFEITCQPFILANSKEAYFDPFVIKFKVFVYPSGTVHYIRTLCTKMRSKLYRIIDSGDVEYRVATSIVGHGDPALITWLFNLWNVGFSAYWYETADE